MRAVSFLLLFSGFGFAVAQDSEPPPAAPDKAAAPVTAPEDSRAAWLTQSAFGGLGGDAVVHYLDGDAVVHYKAPGRREFSGSPTDVCSVRLLEMPIPKDVRFTVRKFHPRPTGDKIYAQVPAPPCPERSR